MEQACLFNPRTYPERSLVWEVTHYCPMRCPHCSTDSGGATTGAPAAEPRSVVRHFRKTGVREIYLTGGEPLLWGPVWEVIEEAGRLGMELSVATTGWSVRQATAERLRTFGVSLIHVSLDAPTASQHDGFRRTPGAFQRAVEAIGLLQKAGLPVFSSTLVRLAWLPQADDMLRLLSRLAIRKAMFSFLVPLGRGSEIASECVPYERRSDIAATLKQAGERWNVDVECRRAHRGDDGLSGCPAGRSLLHLDAAGYVSPCPWLSKLRPELRTALPSWLEMQKIGGAGWRLPPAGEACSGDGCARASECGRGCPVETSLNSKCGRDPLCRQGTIGL